MADFDHGPVFFAHIVGARKGTGRGQHQGLERSERLRSNKHFGLNLLPNHLAHSGFLVGVESGGEAGHYQAVAKVETQAFEFFCCTGD